VKDLHVSHPEHPDAGARAVAWCMKSSAAVFVEGMFTKMLRPKVAGLGGAMPSRSSPTRSSQLPEYHQQAPHIHLSRSLRKSSNSTAAYTQ
jgi:hypothetical protein